MKVDRTVLGSGIRVVTVARPGVRSLEAGVWLPSGARDEPAHIAGASHFIEHMVFKGTGRRSAFEIARAFDAVGGDLNAFTTHESTVLHARVLDADLGLAVDALADMAQNALFEPADVESERSVVLEEISMHDDTPEDSVYDVFYEALWPGHALSRRVQGDPQTVRATTRDALYGWYREHWVPRSLLFVAAGSVEHERVVELVEAAFAGAPASGPAVLSDPPDLPAARAGSLVRTRDIEQAHVAYGTQGISRTDPRRWALGVLNTVLGGGMSSRLFQEVRERRGLAYTISSGHVAYRDCGVYSIHVACSPERAAEVLRIVRDEVGRIVTDGITDEELERAIGQIRGGILVSLDEMGSLLVHLGRGEALDGEVLGVEEIVRRVEAVTLDDVRRVGSDILTGSPWAVAMLGPEGAGDLSDFPGEAA